MTFENALHSPNIACDLISISQLDKKGYQVLFGNGVAKFFTPDGRHFLTGIGSGNLYRLTKKLSVPPQQALVAKSHSLNRPVDLTGWHYRFGHAGTSQIEMAYDKGLLNGLNIIKGSGDAHPICADCRMGQAKRRAFDAVVEQEPRRLFRVHIDLTGPIQPCSLGGYHYSMPIVDGNSAMTKDFYLPNKMSINTLAAMEKYKLTAENETGEKLVHIRVNRGGEFNSDEWEHWADKHGIILEVIPVHSSAANGVAERKHETTFSHV